MPMKADTHRPLGSRSEVERKQDVERFRGSRHERGYTFKWVKARMRFLMKHPLCKECESTGRVTAATVVDHVVPHRGDMKLFWDKSNWQSLCKPHHDVKTAREDGGFGNSKRYTIA